MKPEYPVAHIPNAAGCWHSLEEHLGDVAAQARSYADKFNAGDLAYFAGLWHDLGKLSNVNYLVMFVTTILALE